MKMEDFAVKIGKDWVDLMMEGYQDPQRRGVKKGDAIGFSEKKKRASLLLILFAYPVGVNLKQIATMAKVKFPVFKVWRTERAFKNAEKENCSLFAAKLLKAIEDKQLNPDIVVYFHPLIQEQIYSYFLNKGNWGAFFNLYHISQSIWMTKGKSLASWMRQPEIFEIINGMLKVFITLLADQENLKIRQKRAEDLKAFISETLSALVAK